jgi:hypothetical protein
VWALRAQTDKLEYAAEMRRVLEATPNLYIREAMVTGGSATHSLCVCFLEGGRGGGQGGLTRVTQRVFVSPQQSLTPSLCDLGGGGRGGSQGGDYTA